jgi:hypothetical protein
MPCSGPRYCPAASSRSARAACRRAISSVRFTTQCSAGTYRFSRSRYMRVRAAEVTFRAFRRRPRSMTDAKARLSGSAE